MEESSSMCVFKRQLGVCIPFTFINGLQTGVFSATVAAFLIESYKYLKPDPTDVSARLLQQVTQELAGVQSNPQPLEPFKPPRFAIHVNILWFLSLCMALACGLGATLVQQWVRRYTKLTKHPDSPTNRVRIRTFLFEGIKRFHVRWVVENISLLLHAAIFLFFAGLVEFLFAINDEVARVVVAVIGFFAALYFILTSLPVLSPQCPFWTPLTAVLWYTANFIMIVILSPSALSSHGAWFHELWKRTKLGFDEHILNGAKHKKTAKIEKKAVKMTLGMCCGDTEVEAFLDAVPGYLGDDKAGGRFGHIGSLLNPKEKKRVPSLGQRMGHLISSCITGSGKMNEVERCRRAVTCSSAVSELSKAFSSVTGFTLDLPESIGHKLQQLSHDRHPKIAFQAVRAIALLKRARLKQISEAKDAIHAKSAAELHVAATWENDPTSSLRTGLPDDDRSDGHLLAVTEFTSRILELTTKHSWQPTHLDIEDTKSAIEELCRGLNGSTFSPSTQERLIKVFNETRQAHLASGSTGTVYPQLTPNLEQWLTSWFPLSR